MARKRIENDGPLFRTDLFHMEPTRGDKMTTKHPEVYNFHSQYDSMWMECRRFAQEASIDTFCEKRAFALNLPTLEFIDTVTKTAQTCANDGLTRVIGDHPGEHLIAVDGSEPAQIRVLAGTNGDDASEERLRHNFVILAIGSRRFVLAFFAKLREIYGEARLATIIWWYDGGNGVRCRVVPMEPPWPMHDEFYPWLKEGVDTYLDRFLADRASVLFLMGPPGTGKTSLMRHMIYTRQLAATITYDEKLLSMDEVFVNFLCDPGDAVMIVEDADLMVGSRESEGNTLISRFLNVSDGLVKTSGKKLIFTTNLGDFRHVDSALIRAGRCFDAVRFRPLLFDEAVAAARAAGIAPPEKPGDYTLSDLFAQRASPLELAMVGIGR